MIEKYANTYIQEQSYINIINILDTNFVVII